MKLRAVIYVEVSSLEDANRVGAQFSVPAIDGSSLKAAKPKWIRALVEESLGEVEGDCAFLLGSEGLQLVSFDAGNFVTIAADFCSPTVTYRRLKGGGIGQQIAKAVGIRSGVKPSVLDATAGLGGDAFVLASLGCEVSMAERVPEVRALLFGGMRQAQSHAEQPDAELGEIIARMTLIEADAKTHLQTLTEADAPGVIYLDPMFPQRTKQSLVKKEMRVFHELVGEDADADQLLPLALEKARYRVVVKRPKSAPYLNDQKPSHELAGKSNRYDIYTKQKLPERLP
ncbi:MAG: class I SAM-dependent methyltransferase [Opitutaceae bacterium]